MIFWKNYFFKVLPKVDFDSKELLDETFRPVYLSKEVFTEKKKE
jgi:hypothetical protein